MAGVVAPELDPSHLLDLMEVNGLNLVHALLQVRLSVQHVIGRNVAAMRQSQSYFEWVLTSKERYVMVNTVLLPDFDVVWQEPAVDGLCGVSHEGPAFKAGLLEEPGQSSTMIQMETCKKIHQHLTINPQSGYNQRQKSDSKYLWKTEDSLADEQQIDLSRVNKVDVRESIHSLQTRVDTTVQLQENKWK